MMSDTEVVNALRTSTEEVFSTMLGLEVECGEPYTETNAPGPSDGIIGVVGLAGAWLGTASISCNAAMASPGGRSSHPSIFRSSASRSKLGRPAEIASRNRAQSRMSTT